MVSCPDCTINLERYLSQVAIYAKLQEDERFLTSFKRSSGYVKLLAELDLLSNFTSKSDEDLDDEDETNSLSGKYPYGPQFSGVLFGPSEPLTNL